MARQRENKKEKNTYQQRNKENKVNSEESTHSGYLTEPLLIRKGNR